MNATTETTVRPFSDLIKEIEIDGERFIPIAKIAKLAFNDHNPENPKDMKTWINMPYDERAWYRSELMTDLDRLISIDQNFDVRKYYETQKKTYEQAPSNQMQIFRNLVKWGFLKY